MSKPLAYEFRPLRRPVVLSIQVGIVALFLLGWENAERMPIWGSEEPLFNSFFISSPSRIWDELYEQFFGDGGELLNYLWATLQSSLLGVAIGLVLGAMAGLMLSNSVRLAQIFRPFIVAMNAVPRVALIPVVVIVFGPTFRASIFSAVMVVFFVAFFNAYEGGRTVAPHVLQNAALLGASKWQMMRTIRFPHATAWTFAALPLAVTFGLVTVVTTEILTGYAGIGRLIVISLSTAQSTLTFTAVVVLSIVGLAVVMAAELTKKRVLHWWSTAESGI